MIFENENASFRLCSKVKFFMHKCHKLQLVEKGQTSHFSLASYGTCFSSTKRNVIFFSLSTSNAIYFQNPILVVIYRNKRFILDELSQQNDTKKYRHVFLYFHFVLQNFSIKIMDWYSTVDQCGFPYSKIIGNFCSINPIILKNVVSIWCLFVHDLVHEHDELCVWFFFYAKKVCVETEMNYLPNYRTINFFFSWNTSLQSTLYRLHT